MRRITIRTLKAELKKAKRLELKLKKESNKLTKNLKTLKTLMRKRGYKV